ncbi:MAG: nitroreductase family protein [Polaromonas sp.]|nr:nitroreductase family protein [Polaromonas sp.]
MLQKHRAIAMEAWRIELVTPRTILESFKVLRVGPREIVEHRDGLSINTPMVRALTALGLFDRSKAPGPDDTATTGQIKDFNTKIAATPAFFWMVTEGNARTTQVNAGRAYARAQLAATAQGLAMQPLSQALQEYPEQALPYAAIHALLQAPQPRYTVQMWTRLGYAPRVGPSPRRGLQAHLITAA